MADERTTAELLQAIADLPDAINSGALAQAVADLAETGEGTAAKISAALDALVAASREMAPRGDSSQVLQAIADLRADMAERAGMELALTVDYDKGGRIAAARFRRVRPKT